ncbi:MAG: FecR domain-containing protein [Planctomycetota bacterium]
MNRADQAALILRYLDGGMEAGEQTRLEEMLRTDPATAGLLCDLVLEQVLLHRLVHDTAVRAMPPPARRGWGWLAAVAAAAAGIVLAVVLFSARPAGPEVVVVRPGPKAVPAAAAYPAPAVSGDVRLAAGGLVRGGRVTTGAGGGRLELGGYCRLDLAAGSSVRIAGADHVEQVVLEQGEVLCDVDRGVGTFDVRTGAGVVSVQGTRFIVRTLLNEGDEAMQGPNVFVKVLIGAVLLTGTWGEMQLVAGQEANMPQPRTAAVGQAMSGMPGGSGTAMIEVSDKLYIVSGATLAVVDLKTMKVAARQDLSQVARDIADQRTKAMQDQFLARMDKNGDGEIAGDEMEQQQWLKWMDKNADGKITRDELPVPQMPSPAASGEAELAMSSTGLCMLRSGILFIFDPATLALRSQVTIDEAALNVNIGDMGMPRQGRGGRGGGGGGGGGGGNAHPGGAPDANAPAPNANPQQGNNGIF